MSNWPLVLLILINLFNYIDRQVLAAVQLQVSDEFGLTKSQAGSLVFAFLVVYMICAPIFGWWADRGSKWRLIGISIIVQSFASGGSGLASGFAMLAVMRCVVGVGEAAWGPASPSLISEMYSVEKRGKVLALFYTAIPVGSALGYAVGGAMLHFTGSWRWAFYVLLPPGVLLGILCFLMRDPPRQARAIDAPTFSPRDYLGLLTIPSYAINSVGMTLMTFGIGGISFFMPQYLQADRGISEAHSNIVFGGICAAAGLLATVAGGMVGDRLRTRFPGSYFHVCGVGMLAAFPLFLLLLATPFPYAWGVLFAAVFCLFLNTGPGNAILANVVPARMRSSAFALNILLVHLLGDAISPWMIGRIADHAKTPTTSGLGTGFAVTSFVLLIGGIVWWTGARFLERDTQRALALDALATDASRDRGFDVVVPPIVDEATQLPPSSNL